MRRSAFALLEMIIVLGILGALTAISIPAFREYQIRSDLDRVVQQVTQGLGRAHLLSTSGVQDSSWGYNISNGTLYKGESYGSRDPAFDEVSPISPVITVSGVLDVSYAKTNGRPSTTGDVILQSLDSNKRIIQVRVSVESQVATNEDDVLTICHHNGDGSLQTITIPDATWPYHQSHGDTNGACPGAPPPPPPPPGPPAPGGGGGNPAGVGITLLTSNGKGVLDIFGNGKLTIETSGQVKVNSSNPEAVTVSGNATIQSPNFGIVGSPGVDVQGNGQIIGTVQGGIAPITDPLANLPVPTKGVITVNGTFGNKIVTTLNPGTYNSIILKNQAQVTLNPGVYYVVGSVSVKDSAILTGHGIMIYCEQGSLSLNSGGSVSLSPPGSGVYSGVTYFENRTSTVPVELTGNSNLDIQGALYALSAAFIISGNGAGDVLASSIIGASMTVSGGGTFSIQ